MCMLLLISSLLFFGSLGWYFHPLYGRQARRINDWAWVLLLIAAWHL